MSAKYVSPSTRPICVSPLNDSQLGLKFYNTSLKNIICSTQHGFASGGSTVALLYCESSCAAFWKDNQPGVDIKILAQLQGAVV